MFSLIERFERVRESQLLNRMSGYQVVSSERFTALLGYHPRERSRALKFHEIFGDILCRGIFHGACRDI